jgi:predicted cupin superfamily sugar epimerase
VRYPRRIVSNDLHPETRALVDALGLAPHPEGGFYRETFRAEQQLTLDGYDGPRAASTAIYFLLPAGTFSAFHRVRSDEAWHFYAGDPLELVTFDETRTLTKIVLGPDVMHEQSPQHVVPAATWQAARPVGPRHSLVGCTVAPGFDFRDFEMPSRSELTKRYPDLATTIAELTRDK